MNDQITLQIWGDDSGNFNQGKVGKFRSQHTQQTMGGSLKRNLQ